MNALRSLVFFVFKRLTLAAVGVAASLAVFIVLAHEVHAGETLRWDAAVFHYFQARQQVSVHALMTGVSFLASGWVISGVFDRLRTRVLAQTRLKIALSEPLPGRCGRAGGSLRAQSALSSRPT